MNEPRFLACDITGAADGATFIFRVASGGLPNRIVPYAGIPYRVVTANTTMTQADQRIGMDSSSARTITLPDAASSFNRRFVIMNFGSGTLTVQRAGSDVFTDGSTSITVMQGESLEALGIKRADNTYQFHRS